ncbi:MAG TPA: bacillithiol biosynthesis deacetylase BshB1 [Bryobacteraceae bacterium]|jgi:bacillithiol biosynthesis deacetylase BshB1|nr:bacillithiol biosynthesis deacetylase BshB1 [Bryobacteraceae bacterium]
MPVDVLFFGAHPDDVEWGAGGIALTLADQKVSFGIIDLTAGEMGSRGTPGERALEAQHAAEVLGSAARENLNMPDCSVVDSPENRYRVAEAIRKHKPRIVMAPYWKDRHPDHAAAGTILRNSALYCTLTKSHSEYPPHKPHAFFYYLLHQFRRPSFVVDISGVYPRKVELLKLHRSQFAKTADELGIQAHGMSDYLFGLESRDRYFGSLIGKHHGEALIADRPIALTSLTQLLSL